MDKFKKSLFGYNTSDVNAFIDDIIANVEKIIKSNREKEEKIKRLEKELLDIKNNPDKYISKSTLTEGIILPKKVSSETLNKVHDERIRVIEEKLINNVNEQIRLLEELDKNIK